MSSEVVGFRFENALYLESGDYPGGVREGRCGSAICPITPGPCGCGVRLVEDPMVLLTYMIDEVNQWRDAQARGARMTSPEPYLASQRLMVQVRSHGLVLPGEPVEKAGEYLADPPGTWRCEGVTLENKKVVFVVDGLTSRAVTSWAESTGGFEVVTL